VRPNTPRLVLLSLTLSASLLSADAQTVAPDKNAPRIIFSDRPAILVVVDGQPVLRPVGREANLLRVVNTGALIIFDSEGKKYYLRLMDGWLEAEALDGAWWAAKDAPPSLDRVKDELARGGQVDLLTLADVRGGRRNDGWTSPAKSAPTFAQTARDGTFPNVYVSTVPAELIQTWGGPRFKPIRGLNLLYVDNTNGSVFYDMTSRRFYVLVSGRWLSSGTFDNPWAYVPDRELPAGFRQIPAGHPKAAVLAFVPGTPQAREALKASVIQTTTVEPLKK
jgi:hypothetical protein